MGTQRWFIFANDQGCEHTQGFLHKSVLFHIATLCGQGILLLCTTILYRFIHTLLDNPLFIM